MFKSFAELISGMSHGETDARRRRGSANPAWRGGRRVCGDGYVRIHMPGHPRASSTNYVLEHIVVVERALGHGFDEAHPVHHVDENRSNNANSNLVLCEDQAYHNLLHRRMRAMLACGDPNALPCKICGRYDRQDDLASYVKSSGRDAGQTVAYHRSCNREQAKMHYRRRVAKARARTDASLGTGFSAGVSPKCPPATSTT